MQKKGYKTSEFWVGVFTTIATFLNQAGILGSPLPVDAIGWIAGTASTYIISRGVAKAGK